MKYWTFERPKKGTVVMKPMEDWQWADSLEGNEVKKTSYMGVKISKRLSDSA